MTRVETRHFDEVKKNSACVNRNLILFFLQSCMVCKTRKPLKKLEVGKPIISLGFITRVPVDLTGMSSRRHEDYKWILRTRYHLTKYIWAYPVTSNPADAVAENEVFAPWAKLNYSSLTMTKNFLPIHHLDSPHVAWNCNHKWSSKKSKILELY